MTAPKIEADKELVCSYCKHPFDESKIQALVDKAVLEGRLVELDLLEQAMNIEWPHRPKHNWLNQYKMNRLYTLENHLNQLKGKPE